MKRKNPEDQFRDQIIKVAELNGWRVEHTADRRKVLRSDTSVGFPDLVLCKPPRIIFAELKVGRNEPTDAQNDWIWALVRCNADVYVWYPEHWDEITETLER